MFYRGFYIEIFRRIGMMREGKEHNPIKCDGYYYEVFTDDGRDVLLDCFDAAEGFELPTKADILEAKLFAREMVDIQYKEYCRKRDKKGAES